jgi:hypothetical protein
MNNKIYKYAFIFCFLFPLIVNGQFNFNKGGANQENYFSVIPYNMENNKIIISVNIYGKNRKFILDTGAACTISKALFNELQIKKNSITNVADQSGKIKSYGITTINQISFGGVLFDSIPCLIDENPVLYECLKVDGILGSNLLRNSIVQFAPNKEIILTNDVSKLKLNPKDSSVLFLTPNQSLPYFWITLNGKKSAKNQVLFDSGMDGFYDLSLSLSYYKIFRKAICLISKSWGANTYGFNGVADNTSTHLLRVPLLNINNSSFYNVTTQTTSNNNSRIGVDLLKYGTVTVDYLHKKFYYAPFKEEVDLFKTHFPISLSYKNNKLTVGIIWSRKLKRKISVGDQIIAINNVSYENPDLCSLIHERLLKEQNEATLTIKREDGTIVNIGIKPEF